MNKTIQYCEPFRFKSFTLEQEGAAMKIGTDGVLLGAWADVDGANSILDIGTGTGLIAIMMGQRNESALIDAVEIDSEAAELAKFNCAQAPWHNRLKVHNQAIQEFEHSEGYDLIVCNPPFFTGGTLSNNSNRVLVRHTVKLPNGELIRSVRRLLSSEGRFSVILPYLEGLRFKEIAESSGFHCSRLTEVKGHIKKDIERVLLEFRKTPGLCKVNQIAINKSDKRHDYTADYVELVRPFYTIL